MKGRKSRFMAGDSAVLKNHWPPFREGQAVTIVDPNKRGGDHKILARDARGQEGLVPSKYLN